MLTACLRHDAGLPRAPVLIDAGYGADTDLRAEITALNLVYVVGIRTNTVVKVAVAVGTKEPEPASVEAISIGL